MTYLNTGGLKLSVLLRLSRMPHGLAALQPQLGHERLLSEKFGLMYSVLVPSACVLVIVFLRNTRSRCLGTIKTCSIAVKSGLGSNSDGSCRHAGGFTLYFVYKQVEYISN